MISVVIPARNEARVLGRALGALLSDAHPEELEVIVVCNGCSDDTAEVARSYGDRVTVEVLEEGSKTRALNRGDEVAHGFPRFFVDADVELPLDSLRAVVSALEAPGVEVGAPHLEVDTQSSSWAVRAYYAIWTRLPYHRDGLVGSGVYALTEAGRSRFERFPDLISDDGFVRLLFAPEERVTTESRFRIFAPRRLADLIRIKVRSQKGWLQLRRANPHLMVNQQSNYGGALRELLLQPSLWPALGVYCVVYAISRMRGLWSNWIGDLDVWERDENSRGAADRGGSRS